MISGDHCVRIGILGAGAIAVDHAAAAHALGHKIVLGCSRSQESPCWRSFVTAAPEARFEPDAESLLTREDVDAVVSCLPWNVTEEWLPRLLATAKPVLIEKPVALSSSALSSILDSAGAHANNKWVAFNRRFYPPLRRLKHRLQQGGPKSVEIHISEPLESYVERFGAQIVPHVLAYSSSHILDAALFLLGPLKPVRIYGHSDNQYSPAFRSLTGLLETEQGIPVALAIHSDAPILVGIRIYFDDKTVWHLSPMERLVAYRGYDVMEPTAGVRLRRYTPKPFLEVTVDASLKPGFVEQMRAVTLGDGREIAATPAESVGLLRLIEAIQGAAR